MPRSKKIFFVALAVFFVVMIYVSFDISRKTTFPGSKPQLKERIKNQFLKDSLKADSTEKRR